MRCAAIRVDWVRYGNASNDSQISQWQSGHSGKSLALRRPGVFMCAYGLLITADVYYSVSVCCV